MQTLFDNSQDKAIELQKALIAGDTAKAILFAKQLQDQSQQSRREIDQIVSPPPGPKTEAPIDPALINRVALIEIGVRDMDDRVKELFRDTERLARSIATIENVRAAKRPGHCREWVRDRKFYFVS